MKWVIVAVAVLAAAVWMWRGDDTDEASGPLESSFGRMVASDVQTAILFKSKDAADDACDKRFDLYKSGAFFLGSIEDRQRLAGPLNGNPTGIRWAISSEDEARAMMRDYDRLESTCDAAEAGAWNKAEERLEDVLTD